MLEFLSKQSPQNNDESSEKMNFEGARVLQIALILAPLGIWLAIYAAAQRCSFSLRSFVPWMRKLRWITYFCGVALCLAHFTNAHFFHDLDFAGAVLTFSVGLSMPTSWLRKRLAGTATAAENKSERASPERS